MKTNRILSVILAIAMIMGTMSFNVFAAASTDTWDGTADTSWYTGDVGTYTIDSAEDLAGLAELVNAGNNFAGKTVVLAADLNLAGLEWTPIGKYVDGNTKYPFSGTFNGQGHTISNLKITSGKSYIGLFGYTTNGEVKSLTVNNVKLIGRIAVGAVAGCPYTSKMTNLKVTGKVEIDAFADAGGVLGYNVYGNVTNVHVNADAGSYINAVSTDADGKRWATYVGGVIGFMGEGNMVVSNVSSNLNVIGDVAYVGGITGMAHYSNTFENCVCTGNVTLTSYDGEDSEAPTIGGIAGTWHDGSPVTMVDNSHTGSLNVAYSDGTAYTGDLEDNKLVGATWDGEVESDGKLIVEKGKAAKIGKEYYESFKAAFNAATSGQTVTLLKDLELTETITIDKNMTLDFGGNNVTIKAADGSAIAVNSGNVKIIANGNVNLTGAENHAGIYVAETASLTIQGAGTLTAKGNGGTESTDKSIFGAAGIGGSADNPNSGKITIDGATVNAIGYGRHGAGIGSANNGISETITIKNGANVTAQGGYYVKGGPIEDDNWGKSDPEGGAGIGGGSGRSDKIIGDILISGSTVVAHGGQKAAGIGVGYHSGCGKIEITDGSNVTATGGSGSAGIGTSRVHDKGLSSDAVAKQVDSAKITISDSVVDAEGGAGAAAIGTGFNSNKPTTLTETTVISITNSDVTAKGGAGGAGIGGGLTNNLLDIDIVGSEVNATAGESLGKYGWYTWWYKEVSKQNAAAIGSGADEGKAQYVGSDITIDAASKVTVVPAYGKAAIDATQTGGTVNTIAAEVITDGTNVAEAVAKIGDVHFASLADAVKNAEANDVINIVEDVAGSSAQPIVVDKNLTITSQTAQTFALARNAAAKKTLTDVVFRVNTGVDFALENLAINGLSYVVVDGTNLRVDNCDVDVTAIEYKHYNDDGKVIEQLNCPPAFIQMLHSGNTTSLTITDNTIITATDNTEPYYSYSHAIVGWDYISAATITGNTFGSEDRPLSAAAVKLMGNTENAVVDINNNKFYVNSKDSVWGPVALQLYQNNTRDINYTANISNNEFYTDAATTALGVNASGNVSSAIVEIGKGNKVNGNDFSLSDVKYFGNGVNDAVPTLKNYIGKDIVKDANGKITEGLFVKESAGLVNYVAEGYAARFNGGIGAYEIAPVSSEKIASAVKLTYGTTDKPNVYKIFVESTDGNSINRLSAVQLKFELVAASDAEGNVPQMSYSIAPAKNVQITGAIDDDDNPNDTTIENLYVFNFTGEDGFADMTGAKIEIGTVTFNGYGTFSFNVVPSYGSYVAKAKTAELADNIVAEYVPNPSGDKQALFDLNASVLNATVEEVKREVKVVIDFNNNLKDAEANTAAYNDMTVTLTGSNGKTYKGVVGSDDDETTVNADPYACDSAALNFEVEAGYRYTVTVTGAGYRTARYTTIVNEGDDALVLNFWNNALEYENRKPRTQEIEAGKKTSAKDVTFLAGDISPDNIIDKYDLAAVVSYFGYDGLKDDVNKYGYAKYDLNRDGIIDADDISWVLVSWGK